MYAYLITRRQRFIIICRKELSPDDVVVVVAAVQQLVVLKISNFRCSVVAVVAVLAARQ